MMIILTSLLAAGTSTNVMAQLRKGQREAIHSAKKDTTSVFNKQNKIKEVTVHGRSVERELKGSPMPVEIVDLTLAKRESGNLINVLNRLPGVQLLSNGGVGDPVNVSLNGMDGKSIILFKDGIPLSFFGHAFQLGLIPPNILNRVEIYKGALPISLGADALGGAINFVTYAPQQREVSATYEFGSFSTHRGSVSMYTPDKRNRFFVGMNATYIYSKNNYKLDIGRDRLPGEVYPNDSTMDNSNRQRILNNGVSAPFIEVYGGAKGLSWADELKLSLIGSRYHKEVNRVYGGPFKGLVAYSLEAFADDRTYSATLAHSKKLLNNKLSLQTILGYSHIDAKFIDTVKIHIDRYGNDIGEFNGANYMTFRGSILDLDYDNYLLRFNGTYDLHRNHQLQASHIMTSMNRIGNDPMGGIVTQLDNWDYDKGEHKKADVYQTPGKYRKHTSGFALRSDFFGRTLESLVALKHYYRAISGHSTWRGGESGYIGGTNNRYWGWLAGLSYRPTENWLLKASFERAIRMPDDEEVFGDSFQTQSNFTLEPERSQNFNFQFQYNNGKRGQGEFMVASNLFYRNTTNLMFIWRDIPYSYWVNMENANLISKGVELDVYYRPFSFFSIGGNGTRMERKYKNDIHYLYDKPPLLANLYARIHRDNVFGKDNQLELFWYWNYRHRFTATGQFREPKIGLFEKLTLDQIKHHQLLPQDMRFGMAHHTVGVLYSLAKAKTSIALECRNITGSQLYDTWAVEMPGRSYSLTMRWATGAIK